MFESRNPPLISSWRIRPSVNRTVSKNDNSEPSATTSSVDGSRKVAARAEHKRLRANPVNSNLVVNVASSHPRASAVLNSRKASGVSNDRRRRAERRARMLADSAKCDDHGATSKPLIA